MPILQQEFLSQRISQLSPNQPCRVEPRDREDKTKEKNTQATATAAAAAAERPS